MRAYLRGCQATSLYVFFCVRLLRMQAINECHSRGGLATENEQSSSVVTSHVKEERKIKYIFLHVEFFHEISSAIKLDI